MKDRVPAVLRDPVPPSAPLDPSELLHSVFSELQLDEAEVNTFVIDSHAIHERYANRHLELFVNIGKILQGGTALESQSYDALLRQILYMELEGGVRGKSSIRVSVKFVEYTNYDEYGQGVLDRARVVHDQSFNRSELKAFFSSIVPEPKL